MAENNANAEEQLNQAQKDAIEQLKELQADRKWNDEILKEHISKIKELTSQEAIQEYLEKQKKQDSSQADENTQEDEATKEGDTTKEDETSKEGDTAKEDEATKEGDTTKEDEATKEGDAAKEGDATKEDADKSTATKEENTTSEDKANSEDKTQKSTTVHEVDTSGTVTTVNEVKHDSETENTNDDWKKLRREEWEKYATQERQEFKLLSEDKAPDLNMSVGGTSINYANEHEVTMANTDEYSKFVKLIEIEKKAHTDVINFGEIKSEDYKSKLAAACLQVGLEMSNGPKHIDLSLDCFKNLDDATKQKIEAYNQEQAAKEQSNQSEQGNESKPEPTAEGNGNSNGEGNESKPEPTAEGNGNSNSEGNESKPEPTAADTKNKTKEEYQKLYEAKLAELKAKKEKGESVDFSSIKDPVDRILTYAAAKENDVKMENIQNELLFNENKGRNNDVNTALSVLSEESFKSVQNHERNVSKQHEVREKINQKNNNSETLEEDKLDKSKDNKKQSYKTYNYTRENGGR